MHLIHDENGNLCAHSHDHEHPHTHTYEHTHVHSHEHGHEDDHNHTHEHTHEHAECKSGCDGCGHGHTHQAGEAAGGDKMAALLDYMLKHNEHHAAELDQVSEKLRSEGKTAAAEQIKKAVDEFQKGNLYLSLALASVKEHA